ncbi:MAG: hypothetical protein GY949_16090 [Gammaproteobacteria bacterium]|nr:hypothetical protein [Gammaproteobacteria bacterium]
MLRPALKHSALLILLAGLILRAATPLGYMPASPGSGLLFELCPGQLPAGFNLASGTSGHDHHGHGVEDKSQPEPDQCPIGHLLSSAVAVDDGLSVDIASLQPAEIPIPPYAGRLSASLAPYRSRGPPA